MCEHCRSVGGNQRKIQDQEPVRVLCKSLRQENGSNRKAAGLDCCEWRHTCCGGGCCEATNCCGTGSSGLNVGFKNVSHNYHSKILPMGIGAGINYSMKHGKGMKNNEEIYRGGKTRDAEMVLCGSEKYK